MEIKNINIKKATIMETKGPYSIIVEVTKEVTEKETTVKFKLPRFDEDLLLKLSGFDSDVPFESFVEKTKEQIEKHGVETEKVFRSLVEAYSKFEECNKITVDYLSSSEEDKTDLHDFVKNYNIFDIEEGNSMILGTGDRIKYSEIEFTAVFDRKGEMLRFEQPNMAKPKPFEEFADRIEGIKKRLF